MNATDKELLEMAARAAGYVIAPHVNRGISSSLLFTLEGRGNWNPLRDDGDALRLAVELRLNVELDHDWITAVSSSLENPVMIPVNDGDILSATRKAIVICAAEIGKSMTKESGHEH